MRSTWHGVRGACAADFGLAVVEDAAHALPVGVAQDPGRRPGGACGSAGSTRAVTCFSFYANKTITTGEGGMAVTDRRGARASAHAADVAPRHLEGRLEALQLLGQLVLRDRGRRASSTTSPTWPRPSGSAPARARAEAMRAARPRIARRATESLLGDLRGARAAAERPGPRPRLAPLLPCGSGPSALTIDRDAFIEELRRSAGSASPFTGGRCTCTPTTATPGCATARPSPRPSAVAARSSADLPGHDRHGPRRGRGRGVRGGRRAEPPLSARRPAGGSGAAAGVEQGLAEFVRPGPEQPGRSGSRRARVPRRRRGSPSAARR